MNRNDHLASAKRRALECVDRGALMTAVSSMIADLHRHEELEAQIGLGAGYRLKPGWVQSPQMVREWIEGFK
jgi:hypothetical protein